MKNVIISSKRAAYILTFLLGLFILFSPPLDADFGWHYRYGEIITKTQSIPTQNIFSYTFEDYEWANSYWMAQVLMYLITNAVGETGLSMVMSLIFIAFSIFFLKKTKPESDIRLLIIPLLVFFLLMSQYRISIRPLLFSSIAMLTLIYVLTEKESRVGYLPILFCMWANIHADFVLGYFVFILYIFAKLLEKQIKPTDIAALIISGFATIFNPAGIHLHQTLFKEAHPFQFFYIQEWQPLWHVNITILVFVLIITFLIVFYWKEQPLFLKMAVLIFFGLTFRFGYFSRVFVILGFTALVTSMLNIWEAFLQYSFENKAHLGKLIIRLVLFLLVPLYSLIFFQKVNLANSVSRWSKEGEFPYQAIEYIKENEIKGNIFNSYSWGGYLIWKSPDTKVFIDGRMPSWRVGARSVFEDYINIVTKPEENFQTFETYRDIYSIKYALLKRNSDFISYLLKDGWEIIYVDDVAVLLEAPAANFPLAQKAYFRRLNILPSSAKEISS